MASVSRGRTIALGLLSLLGVLSSFAVQWFLITALGAGAATDALFAAMTLPQLALAVVSGSLVNVLVPMLAGESSPKLREDSWAFVWIVGGFFFLLGTGLAVSASLWVPLLLPGFGADARAMAVEFSRVHLAAMVFTAVNGVQTAVYHARQRFLWPELAAVLSNILAVVAMALLLSSYGAMGAAWIWLARAGVLCLVLLPGMGMPSLKLPWAGTGAEAWRRIRPLLLGTIYYKTDPLVERYLLSSAVVGSLSIFYLAQQLLGAVSQVINRAVASPLVPVLSALSKAGDIVAFRLAWRKKILEIGVLSLLAYLVFVVFGRWMLGLLVGWGRFGGGDLEELWVVMVLLGLAFWSGAAGSVSSVSFYALGDTRTPTRIGVVTYTVYVPLKVGAYYCWGVAGLAIFSGVFVFVNLVLQVYWLERQCLRVR